MVSSWTLSGIMLPSVHCHFGLIRPAPWMNSDNIGSLTDVAPVGTESGQKHFCYVNHTFRVGYPTNNNTRYWSVGMSYQKDEPFGKPHIAHRPHGWQTPWESPGSAPVTSPCGHYGGNANGCCPYNLLNPDRTCMWGLPKCAYGGTHMGEDCREKKFNNQDFFTEWQANSIEITGFGIVQNHGGGYAYRLCKMIDGRRESVTEECFQNTHLEFGPNQFVKKGTADALQIPRAEVIPIMTVGTHPEGSNWRLIPAAPCAGMYTTASADCVPGSSKGEEGPTPPSVAPDLFGYGTTKSSHAGPVHQALRQYMILDEVKVPDLEPGDYVLSGRFEAEQNPQIWLQCANIRIVPKDTSCTVEKCYAEAKKRGMRFGSKRVFAKWPTGCFHHQKAVFYNTLQGGPSQNNSDAKFASGGATMLCAPEVVLSQKYSTKLSHQVTMSVDDQGSIEQM